MQTSLGGGGARPRVAGRCLFPRLLPTLAHAGRAAAAAMRPPAWCREDRPLPKGTAAAVMTQRHDKWLRQGGGRSRCGPREWEPPPIAAAEVDLRLARGAGRRDVRHRHPNDETPQRTSRPTPDSNTPSSLLLLRCSGAQHSNLLRHRGVGNAATVVNNGRQEPPYVVS